MSKINQRRLTQIRNLYKSGSSMKEIARDLGFTINEVCYFFRKNKIQCRSRIESNGIKFQRKKPSFAIKQKLSVDELILKTIGVMLYWGEGSKWSGEKIVDLANSDAEMIRLFLSFLRKICGIKESKLRAFVYCYKNQSAGEIIKFWSSVTKIPKKQFTKPYIKKYFDPAKTQKMVHGLIHIRYGDKKLLLQIKEWIEEYKEYGQIPKRSTGRDCKSRASAS